MPWIRGTAHAARLGFLALELTAGSGSTADRENAVNLEVGAGENE